VWERALAVASHVTHPVSLLAVAVVLASFMLLRIVLKKGRSRLAWFLAVLILLFGLAPLLSSTYLQSKGLYHVRVFVLGIDKQPIDDQSVSVTSSNGGEPKKVKGGWEFDIPPQSRPADAKLKLFASLKSAYLTGSSTLVLDKDYFPTIEIQLAQDTSATVRGIVIDEHRRSVSGSQVWILGYSDIAVTDRMGNFVLAAHAADGQMVHLRAQKDQMTADVSAPTGNEPVELMLKRQ
jgi:hypothetical protein